MVTWHYVNFIEEQQLRTTNFKEESCISHLLDMSLDKWRVTWTNFDIPFTRLRLGLGNVSLAKRKVFKINERVQ